MNVEFQKNMPEILEKQELGGLGWEWAAFLCGVPHLRLLSWVSEAWKRLYIFCLFVLVLFNYSCPHFPLWLLSCLSYSPPHLPHSILPHPVVFVHASIIHVPWPFLVFNLLSSSPLPSGYYQFVLYFNVSGYILLTCLFCWLGSTYRWDHMIFVFHCLAYFT